MRMPLPLLFIFRFVVKSNFSHSDKEISQAQSQLFKNNCFDLIMRKDLVITRKDVVLTRNDLIIKRKDVVLKRKDVVSHYLYLCI